MTPENRSSQADAKAETIRTVGQIVKYSREVNQSDTAGEVGTYALEAAVHVLDRHPTPTVVEVAAGERRVLETMAPDCEPDGGPVVGAALEARSTVVAAADGVDVDHRPAEVDVRPAAELADRPAAAVSVAAPSIQATDEIEAGVVLLVRWPDLDRVEPYHVKPVEYLADHVATALANIRSRERLERARNDLATRKEMIELYDRLLRHDLGNHLQIIAGFADSLVRRLDGHDEAAIEDAERIRKTATRAADLIERVGDLVKTLEQEDQPRARDLGPILESVVAEVDETHGSLTVAFDPAEADDRVYGGDLLDAVFKNVLSNAAVHNEGSVAVDLEVETPNPETVVVTVADDGRGVPETVREDLFEVGKKGPDSGGSGFGLGLARALTESYGGSIEVHDSDAGGARFRIALERAG
jgi:signal transduction histidine kinase